MEQIINFIFSKEAFSGLATILAGLVAFIVYWLHKQDERIKAARVVLQEIRNAEQQIIKIKNDGVVSDFSSVMPFSSWQQYSHLFVKVLDRDELALISNFYIACTLAEVEITRIKNFLPIAMEQKSKSIQSHLVELAKQNIGNEKKYQQGKDEFLAFVHKEDYWFLPNTPKEKLIHYINNIQFVANTVAGTKLKQVARE